MGRKLLYREYDEEGNLVKKECSHCHEIRTVDNYNKCKKVVKTIKYILKIYK